MWLRSSCGYDTNDVTPQRVCDEEHATIDKTNRIEAQLAIGTEIIELNKIGIQEHLRGSSESDTVLCGWLAPWR
jgi:hypothetical protein